jgi:hypothetical protein
MKNLSWLWLAVSAFALCFTVSCSKTKPVAPSDEDVRVVAKFLGAVEHKDLDAWLSTLRCYERDMLTVGVVSDPEKLKADRERLREKYKRFFLKKIEGSPAARMMITSELESLLYLTPERFKLSPMSDKVFFGASGVYARLDLSEPMIQYQGRHLKSAVIGIPVVNHHVSCLGPGSSSEEEVRLDVRVMGGETKYFP